MQDSKPKVSSKDMENVILSILGLAEAEHLDRVETIPESTREAITKEYSTAEIAKVVQEFAQMVSMIRGIPAESPLAVPLANGTLKQFFCRYIEKTEGIGCSTDKASFIVSSIEKSLMSGLEYSLYSDYSHLKADYIKDKTKQAYWSPVKIKDTSEAKKIFLDWFELNHLKNKTNVVD